MHELITATDIRFIVGKLRKLYESITEAEAYN